MKPQAGSNGRRGRIVAVVGGGASGALVAAQLLCHPAGNVQVHLIERRPEVGRGVAYGTHSMRHLLNVPAASMSAFPEAPDHFLLWLKDGPLSYATPETFAPRRLFGDYLREVLRVAEHASPNGSLERTRAEAVAVEARGDHAAVRLGDGREVRADQVVLALGNLPPRNPRIADASFYDSPRYVADAWSPGVLDGIQAEAPVLLIGTSLTAIDVAIDLKERGHGATIHAVSRRGLVPNPHKRGDPYPPYPPFLSPQDPDAKSVRDLVRRVRGEVGQAVAQRHDWRGVVEALRPEVQTLWGALSIDEKRRFLRHVQPYWEVHRHRIAPEIGDAVRMMSEEDSLIIHAGRILSYDEDPDGVDVHVPQEAVERCGPCVSSMLSIARPPLWTCATPITRSSNASCGTARRAREPSVSDWTRMRAARCSTQKARHPGSCIPWAPFEKANYGRR